MPPDNQQMWIDEFERLRAADPDIVLLDKKASSPGVPHAAPQISYGSWVLSGAQHDTFAVLRWKDGTTHPNIECPPTWLLSDKKEANFWGYRVLDAFGKLESLLQEMRLIQDFEDGVDEPESTTAANPSSP